MSLQFAMLAINLANTDKTEFTVPDIQEVVGVGYDRALHLMNAAHGAALLIRPEGGCPLDPHEVDKGAAQTYVNKADRVWKGIT